MGHRGSMLDFGLISAIEDMEGGMICGDLHMHANTFTNTDSAEVVDDRLMQQSQRQFQISCMQRSLYCGLTDVVRGWFISDKISPSSGTIHENGNRESRSQRRRYPHTRLPVGNENYSCVYRVPDQGRFQGKGELRVVPTFRYTMK